jgi:putative transposase
MCMFFDDWPDKPEYVVCHKDKKFTQQFEAILKSGDIELKRTAVRTPNQNAYAERFAQTLQRECLDHFVVLGKKHLRYLVQEFVAYYNEQRLHSSRGNLPLSMDSAPDPVECLGPTDVVCHERLGGLLKHYERKAA